MGCSSLTSVTISDGVVGFGWNAFSGCNNLTSITINTVNFFDEVFMDGIPYFNGIKYTLKDGNLMISGCDCNIVVANILDSLKIDETKFFVTKIGKKTFSRCSNLTSITIPNSVTKIEDRAFAGCCSLTSVIIPDSVTEIGARAFEGCTNLASITIPEGIAIGKNAFKGCKFQPAKVAPAKSKKKKTRSKKKSFLKSLKKAIGKLFK